MLGDFARRQRPDLFIQFFPVVLRQQIRCRGPVRLGHESLDVTLAHLKDKDAESEEAQGHANSSSLALYA